MPNGDLPTYVRSQSQPNLVSLVRLSLCLPNTSPQLPLVGRRCKGPPLSPFSRRDPRRSEGGERLRASVDGLIDKEPTQPNVLVDASNHARITDFGLTQDTLHAVFMAEGQSARWTAPEVLAESGTPSTEADVFSFGMVMVEVCCNSGTGCLPYANSLLTTPWHKTFSGTVPFNDHNSPAAMTAIMRGKRPAKPTHLTDDLWELVNRCWDQDRHNRPRMSEVLLALNPLIHEGMRTSVMSELATFSMAAPLLNIQRQLRGLSASDNGYRALLLKLLSHRDLKSHIHALQGNDLEEFVELLDNVGEVEYPYSTALTSLDQALDRLPATDDLVRKTLRRLRSTCSNREVLPSSYLISNQLLLQREKASMGGGLTDVYGAQFKGKKVSITALRPYSQGVGGVTRKVRSSVVCCW